MSEEKFLKINNFLKEKFEEKKQAFNTRNIMGDYMYTIYDEDGVQIDYAPDYDYIEIFGLTDVEWLYFKKYGHIY